MKVPAGQLTLMSYSDELRRDVTWTRMAAAARLVNSLSCASGGMILATGAPPE
ncbi:hypothetical protein L516_2151 [Bordetella bronchiseptica MBORD668]|nr:hypothetical protein L516_2151 [Bordetella bronchiseptica MBORD668]